MVIVHGSAGSNTKLGTRGRSCSRTSAATVSGTTLSGATVSGATVSGATVSGSMSSTSWSDGRSAGPAPGFVVDEQHRGRRPPQAVLGAHGGGVPAGVEQRDRVAGAQPGHPV